MKTHSTVSIGVFVLLGACSPRVPGETGEPGPGEDTTSTSSAVTDPEPIPDPDPTAPPEDGQGTPSTSGGASSDLRWFTTCGDPVCGRTSDDPKVADCTSEKEGGSCGQADQLCELAKDACNAYLVCARSDPKNNPGGCPISLASAKEGISYLSEAETARIRDEVLQMPLATWRYIHEGGEKEHLGFIIDDQPSSCPAVRPAGDRVDLYGYTSMAIAAIQAQAREIEDLKREVAALRDIVRGSSRGDDARPHD